MPQDPSDIERRIRTQFPISFGDADAVDDKIFQAALNDATEYALAATGPYLGAEAIRYQSMLLYISLIFISLKIFAIGDFKWVDHPISVDGKFLWLYASFMAAVALIFLIKCYVDDQRNRLLRAKNSHLLPELKHLLDIATLRIQIENYFWIQVFDTIGATYKYFSDATARALEQEPNFRHIPMADNIHIELDQLRGLPELVEEITRHELRLSSLKSDLQRDVARFSGKLEKVFADAAIDGEEERQNNRFHDITAAFDNTLKPWFEARNKLTSMRLKRVIDDLSNSPHHGRYKILLSLYKRISNIRRVYVAIEIVAPMLLACLAVFYGFI